MGTPATTPAEEVLRRFRGDPAGQVRHFGSPDRVAAALDLAKEGVLVCTWVPIGESSAKEMLACTMAPAYAPSTPSGGLVA